MTELLRVQGYAATSIKQLAEAAGAPTGSIYHHFKGGKREVAAAALRQAGADGRRCPMIRSLRAELLKLRHPSIIYGVGGSASASGPD